MRTESNPVGKLVEAFLTAAFHAHPYWQPPVGWASDVENFGASDAQEFFKTYYVPGKMTIAIVGDVGPKQARRLAERIIQLGKNGSLHDRRQAIEKLGSNEAAQKAVKWVFSELKERFKDRQGGYTRILKLPRTIRQAQSDLPRNPGVARSKMYGTNLGDNAPLVLWELCEAQITKKERPKKAARNWKPKAKEEVKAPAK